MGYKIAIIEDDPVILKMYELKFTTEGFTVKTATNGKLGLELIKNFKPDLVLLDLMMPEMTGDEMLSKLRKTDWGKHTKVVIVTNIGNEELPKELAAFDVTDIILKAYHTPAQVVKKVKKILTA